MMRDAAWAWIGDAASGLGGFWINQLGGTFLLPGSTLSVAALTLSLLLAAFLAVPRGRKTMPRLAVWRRALLPNRLIASASGRADLAWCAFSLLFFGLVFASALFSSDVIADAVTLSLRDALGPAPLPLPAVPGAALLTGGAFLAYELAYWLDHRLKHASAFFWQFHRVHHAAESLSLLTTFRVHPVDTIVFYNIVALVMGGAVGALHWLLGPGVTPWTIGGTNALNMATAIALTHLQHSHLWIQFGPRWNRWLLSPAHHQIHHSADPADFDRNFGNTLAIWDRLFGTLRLPASAREPLRFGLGAAERAPHGWAAATIDPLVRAAALVAAPLGRRWRGGAPPRAITRRLREAALPVQALAPCPGSATTRPKPNSSS